MNNFQLVQTTDLSDGMDEAQAAMFMGATQTEYVVTNPAWNNRLNDTTSHAAFREYMANELCVPSVQGPERWRSGCWSFSYMDL
tara:strand:- start:1933 stop:2184 length:252 start_codon:yes stop_codon:yes gene_type:complete